MNATTEAIINLNNAECIKGIVNIGNTQYQNICTGAISTVPWGVFDWVVGFFIITVVISATVFIVFSIIASQS